MFGPKKRGLLLPDRPSLDAVVRGVRVRLVEELCD